MKLKHIGGLIVIIFFCPTKYSLINCLYIKYTCHPNNKALLFLYDQNNVFLDITNKLRGENIFEDIFFTPIVRGTNAVARWVYTLLDLITFDSKYKRFFSGMDCSIIYTHGNNYALDIIHKNLIKKNPDLHWIIYEEGLGSYVIDPENDYTSKSHVVLKLFSLIKPKNIQKIMLYMPEIDTVKRSYPVIPLTRINPSDKNFISLVNKVFSYTDFEYKYNIIYLSQPWDYSLQKNVNDNVKSIERNVLLLIQKETGQKIAVKPHPRNRNTIDFCDLINDCNPFELSLLNQDITNKVLVTIASTAAITPKVILDKEPIVIILIKLFKKYIPEKDFLSNVRIFEKIKLSYNTPSNFFIPETEEDIRNILPLLYQRG